MPDYWPRLGFAARLAASRLYGEVRFREKIR